MNQKRACLMTLFVSLIIFNAANSASISVGEGSFVDFGGAQITTESLSIDNSGEVDFGTSQILLTDLSNQANAFVNAANSVLSITGNWFNVGDFDPVSSTVRFIDGPATSVQVTGDTTFNELIAMTAVGKVLSFEAGSTQTIATNLEFTGVDGNLLTIVSTIPGAVANISLNRDASQLIDYVDVTDNYGIWQRIAPGSPADYNSIQGSNVRGWFGTPLQFPVPTLSVFSLILLALSMIILFFFSQRKQLKIKG
jgi:hypothetical protein